MTKTFTSNDVMRYFYGEVSKDEKNEIEEALAFSNTLQDMYCEIEESAKMLRKATLQPAQHTIDAILQYSKSFAPVH